MKTLSIIITLFAICFSFISCNTEKVDSSTVEASLNKLNTYFEKTGHTGVSDLTEGKTARITWEEEDEYFTSDTVVDEYGNTCYVMSPRILDGRSITISNYHWKWMGFFPYFHTWGELTATLDNGQWTWKAKNEKILRASIEEIDKYVATN
jgi:hypothetical protein